VTARVDAASRWIPASPDAVYGAFAEPGAIERWLPPDDMSGTMLHFDFREGGSYRMRLTYPVSQRGHGKTSADADDVTVRLTRLVPGHAIEQEIDFESEDPAFGGTMRMIWSLVPERDGTLVTVRAEDVPAGCAAGAVGEVAQYENAYRLCYLRGPEGILFGLAQELGRADGS
jgi:uncharacterized protein YndB with AHSA1/START domain